VLTGLHEFALEHNATGKYKLKKFFTSTITDWAEQVADFKRNELLTNTHKLSKYIRAHKSAVYQLTGILEIGKESNKTYYQFKKDPIPRKDA
jgi:hypothetical protein